MNTAKKLTAILLAMALTLALAACGGGTDAPNTDGTPQTGESDPADTPDPEPEHTHTWVNATCTTPKTCSECGETEGEPLGHEMVETSNGKATECSRCGRIEGLPEADGITWFYENDTLTVSGDGPISDYFGSDEAPWYKLIALGKTKVHLVIEDGITSIGAYAFYGFCDLLSVEIPDSVTAIKEGAFAWCAGLEHLTIPDSVMTIGPFAFSKIALLQELTIPAGVTEIGGGITAGDQKVTVQVAEGNSHYVVVDNILFTADMTKIVNFPSGSREEYTVPDGVTTIGDRSFAYSMVDNVTVPEGVTTIGTGAFYYSYIDSITLPASLTTIESDAFTLAQSLDDLVVPGNVTDIGENAFNYAHLKTLTLPAGLTGLGANALEGCASLTDLYFGGTTQEWAAVSAEANVPETVTVHYGA